MKKAAAHRFRGLVVQLCMVKIFPLKFIRSSQKKRIKEFTESLDAAFPRRWA